MADNEAPPPGPPQEIPSQDPQARPPKDAEEPGQTLGGDSGGEYDIILSPAHSQTAHFDNSPTAQDPPELPVALVDHPRYRVVRWLGSGGMGAVYLAEHRLMERQVALKLINRDLTDHAGAVERFGREVRAAARLQHPQIVTAFDAEQAGPIHFLVMEFVEGTDLARLVKRLGPLPVHVACDAAVQAASGLQHAHEHGMVHRDIKPQNLMRTKRGQIKILDFGLAIFASEVESGGGFTGTGAMLGTADYVAPEQADDAHSADIRADIYSLGCTLYYLLAGHPPFPGGTLFQKLSSHSRKKPRSLREIRDDLPVALERVLDRMMAKDPKDRYQTPAEVAKALSPFAGPSAIAESPGSVDDQAKRLTESFSLPFLSDDSGPIHPARRFRIAVLVALALLMVGGFLSLAAYRGRKERPDPTGLAGAAGPTSPPLSAAAPPPEPPTTPVPVPPTTPVPVPPTTPAPVPPTAPAPKPSAEPNVPVPTESVSKSPAAPAPSISATPAPSIPAAPAPRIPSPDEVLQSKRLTRDGRVYRLQGEAKLDGEFDALRALWTQLVNLSDELDRINMKIDERLAERGKFNTTPLITPLEFGRTKADIDAIAAQNEREISRATDARRQVAAIDQELNMLRPNQQSLVARIEIGKNDFQERQKVVESHYVSLLEAYQALRLDPEVTAAIEALNKMPGPSVVLGPVRNQAEYRARLAGSAAQVLKLKGLVPPTKGVRYLLESELMAKSRYIAFQRAFENLKKAEAAPRLAVKPGADLQAQRKKKADELATAVLPQRKAELKAQLNLLDKQIQDKQIELARTGPASPEPDVAGPDSRADTLQAIVDLRKAAEAVRIQRDAALAEDQEVKEALADLNKGRRDADKFRVASEPEAEAALKLLEKIQKDIDLREVPVRTEAGVRLVDISLNGGRVSGMVLDPKVAGLRLPAALAAGAGVGPTPGAGTVTIKNADGQLVSARRATLQGLKLGPIDLADVPCLILSPEAGDLPPSFGTRSLGDFATLLDPDGSKLYVARIGALLERRP